MQLQLITPPRVEATASHSGKGAELARAGDALVESGLIADLASDGATVVGRARPELDPAAVTDDPIVNLGRYNALIADAVTEALSEAAPSLLLGGTCNHLPGMLAGLQRRFGAAARIGLVWFDAHGDFNTPRTTRSGMLGGMPVAVCAGLCHAPWRELAGLAAPLPTDRIVMVDVRNLDPDEAALIAATDVQIARFGDDGDVESIVAAVSTLAERVDHLYLHVDADVLDATEQPNHPTAEPLGPSLASTINAIEAVMATGRVGAFGVVSVNPTGPEGAVSLRSATALIRAGVRRWATARV